MRVIAGTARGVPLSQPRDRSTRPIADRVKETLFGILGERVIDARALDLYAGSGAIGIEALSRGAAAVTFVERGRRALDAIEENLHRTHLGGGATVRGGDVLRFLASAGAADVDLVFLDPPYAERDILAPLAALGPHLAPGGTVVLKHHWRTERPSVPGLRPWRERRLGETSLTFLEQVGENGPEEVA